MKFTRIPSRARAAVARRRAVWAAAHLGGMSMRAIARRWGFDPKSVRVALDMPRRREP